MFTFVYSFFNFVFYFATFTSPNFSIMIDYSMIPLHSDTFGRMWFAIANLVFWMMNVLVAGLLLVGVKWGYTPMFRPFVFWSVVGIIQEGIGAIRHFIYWEHTHQIIFVVQKTVLSIVLPIYFIIIVVSYSLELDYEEMYDVRIKGTKVATSERIPLDKLSRRVSSNNGGNLNRSGASFYQI